MRYPAIGLVAVLFAYLPSGPADAQGPALTVYEQGAAVVSSSQQIELAEGRQLIRLTDLPRQLLPESLFLRNSGVRLAGLRYGEALLSRANLLERFVGRQVTLLRDDGQGGDLRAQATLLSVEGGVPVVRFEDRVETLSERSPWRIAVAELPDGLPQSPLLGLELEAEDAGVQPLDLTYQVNGLSWRADHLGVYQEDAGRLDWRVRARMSNDSGGDYRDAQVDLISGDIQRQGGSGPPMAYARQASMEADVNQQAAFEYHRYSLERPVTLLDGESRLIPLLSGSLEVEREYRVENGGYSRSGERSHARIYLRFDNSLERPLPAGTVRVYDDSSQPMLLGEDHIGHTPENLETELVLGQAFDITAERTITDTSREGRVHESERRVLIENAKDESVKVKVIESLPGDWEIVSQNLPHEKLDANRVAWIVGVPAEGKAALKYRVRYR